MGKLGRVATFWVFIGFGLSACSTVSILNSPSEKYRKYVRRQVQESKIFDRGRLILSIKALPANQSLYRAQEQVSPGFAFAYKENIRQVIVAVGLPNASDFAPQDLQMTLGGRASEWVHEIDSTMKEETHYAFAHPFHRVFLVDFAKPESRTEVENFEVRSPRGAVRFELNFREQNEER